MAFSLYILILFGSGISILAETRISICSKCDCAPNLLDCSDKNYTDHFDSALWSNTNFTTVNFNNNNLVHLKPFPLVNIAKLSFKHNQIAAIDRATFRFIQGLEELDLSHNHLTTPELHPHIFMGNYNPEAYEPLTDLKILRLDGNSLHSLHRDLFEHLPNLKELTISFNPFKIIDQQTIIAISSIRYLQILDMSSNQLSDIPPRMFHTTKYLKTLNLSSNNFAEIPLGIGEAHSLETLIMDNNPIFELKSAPHVLSLKTLHLNNMPELEKILNGSLSTFPALQVFQCTHNRKLKTISEDTFIAYKNPENVWPTIKEFYLNDNKLRYLGHNILSRLDLVENWTLHNNPWVCDCLNQWHLTTLLPLVSNKNPKEAERMRCEEPEEMKGKYMAQLRNRSVQMRCLDKYGSHPGKDTIIMFFVLFSIFIIFPIVIIAHQCYQSRSKPRRDNINTTFSYTRAQLSEHY